MKWAAALALLAGCFDDNYTCATDADCNLGAAGRCELDHHCTQYDSACPLARSYTPHSGAESGTCLVEDAVPIDPCAGEQPAAPISDPCAAAVCAAEPQCCTTGWTDACVQQAQLRCSIRCDTRIAVMIEKGTVVAPTSIDLFDVRFDGTSWTIKERGDRGGLLTWIAPEPGATEPRLVGLDPAQATLLVGDPSPIPFPVSTVYHYDTFTTVDFERSGRDTAMLTSYDAADHRTHTLLDLTSGGERDITTTIAAPVERWGDFDGDAFPDASAANGSGGNYHFLANTLDADHVNQLQDNESATSGGGNAPQVRSFEWIDFDHNGITDLVEIGAVIQIHLGTAPGGLRSIPTIRIDCDPPLVQPNGSCNSTTMPGNVDWAATTLPRMNGVDLVASFDDETPDSMGKLTSRSTNLYLLHVTTGPATLTATPLVLPVPCTGVACPLIRAIVARDLDGDGVLDLVTIDSHLTVLAGRGLANGTFMPFTIVGVLPAGSTNYNDIRVSVSGALR